MRTSLVGRSFFNSLTWRDKLKALEITVTKDKKYDLLTFM
ncbi:hypothetical protein VCRA2122O12_140111 [Vibrio crassostreae]|nr:hypothetical protein VCRA2110O1_70014 [Vibrio crassostreae]CAK2158334.1 hypothetical protein VCRA2110O4_70163 [Vibrio crassostreae]CAK2176706.1 hypothetical protein VCRA2114E5_90014 [Vibrio crassostreae]CAK2582945.1 hypothetical protein VCRA2110O2_150112 [Vibrio crassostreae]CAK2638821.1 hypothetical protein VCRA2127O15_100014 [Vibrio crassostreae]